MGLFKKKIIKEIEGGTWGHLVSVHKLDVDTLTREIRCVEQKGTLKNGVPVTLLRVFKLKQASDQGVEVTGWETFDEHPDLILFDGYVTANNQAHLERKQPLIKNQP
jgi:hypothetical protein